MVSVFLSTYPYKGLLAGFSGCQELQSLTLKPVNPKVPSPKPRTLRLNAELFIIIVMIIIILMIIMLITLATPTIVIVTRMV